MNAEEINHLVRLLLWWRVTRVCYESIRRCSLSRQRPRCHGNALVVGYGVWIQISPSHGSGSEAPIWSRDGTRDTLNGAITQRWPCRRVWSRRSDWSLTGRCISSVGPHLIRSFMRVVFDARSRPSSYVSRKARSETVWIELGPCWELLTALAAYQSIFQPSDTSASDLSNLEFVRYTNFVIIIIIIKIIIFSPPAGG